ncbi:hypothetical protein P5G61_05950 [Paenibacillus sp. F6_3S_P_1C]|uniref:FbpB family small basic protein n=1 Tax=Paenibacillus vandeheii TaxID=3035917 RepID=A0ABT8J6P5_9BACL|nr:hypothetical protein [Paenibacillus vandeheii]MDN4600761.1 hypothetical protein [Paenibacillus vandeheii]
MLDFKQLIGEFEKKKKELYISENEREQKIIEEKKKELKNKELRLVTK